LETSEVLQSVLASGQTQKHYPGRVMFARVGWMTYYAGPQTGDERPIGGGENNKKNLGHEVFNFTDFAGQLYGFVRTKGGCIKLERIDSAVAVADTLDDVLVVFVARQRVIGWYKGAIVHRTGKRFPTTIAMEIRKRLKRFGTRNFRVENYR